jgi:hypothetical protein
MAPEPGGVEPLGFAALRPVLVGALLVVDAGAVLVLGIGRHKGWLPPFIGFGMVLVGLIWFFGWSVRHRQDDDPGS